MKFHFLVLTSFSVCLYASSASENIAAIDSGEVGWNDAGSFSADFRIHQAEMHLHSVLRVPAQKS